MPIPLAFRRNQAPACVSHIYLGGHAVRFDPRLAFTCSSAVLSSRGRLLLALGNIPFPLGIARL